MLHVVVLLRPDSSFHRMCPQDYLRRRVEESGARLTIAPDRQALAAALREADVYVGTSIDSDALSQARRLRWIHSPTAGVERLMTPAVINSGVIVTNSRGAMAPEVAEHTLALVLALARGIDLSAKGQAEGRWVPVREVRAPRAVAGLTMGIVGYGSIGRELARRARCLGMRVVGVRRRPDGREPWADYVVGPDGMSQVLAESDVVVLAVPLVEETRHLIGREELAMMKNSAFLINVARGAVVDEAALVEALRSGQIAAAASDVFSEEPLPADHPLWKAPNFLLTPHVAGTSEHYWVRVIDLFCDNLLRWRRGEPLTNRVDLTLGY